MRMGLCMCALPYLAELLFYDDNLSAQFSILLTLCTSFLYVLYVEKIMSLLMRIYSCMHVVSTHEHYSRTVL